MSLAEAMTSSGVIASIATHGNRRLAKWRQKTTDSQQNYRKNNYLQRGGCSTEATYSTKYDDYRQKQQYPQQLHFTHNALVRTSGY